MPVSTQHPQYAERVAEKTFVAAVADGTREVKKLETKILPAPNTDDAGNYDKQRYKKYMQRAIFMGVTGRTRSGLSGAAFRTDHDLTQLEDTTVDYLINDFDGNGLTLNQFTKKLFNDLSCSPLEGLLVDYPAVDSAQYTKSQIRSMKLQATVKHYACESIISWKEEVKQGRIMLSRVVLCEMVEVDSDDEFNADTEKQYRVLRLTDAGATMQLYDKDEKPITEQALILDYSGSPFDVIPFTFVGPQNNDANYDHIVLSDIAYVNAGHYRNSADLEENCYLHGQLTVGISTELSVDQFQKLYPNGMALGAMAAHNLGKGGSFTSVQAEPNQLADKLMERKEAQMIALGARLIENRGSLETATQAKIDATGQNSVLADMVTNIESAVNQCIAWVGRFMGYDNEVLVKLNRQFFPEDVDPQFIMAGIQLYDRGIIAKADLQDLSRKADIVAKDRTNESIDEEVGELNPLETTAMFNNTTNKNTGGNDEDSNGSNGSNSSGMR